MKTTTKEQIGLNLVTFFKANINAADLMDWTSEATLCVHQDTALNSTEKERIIFWLNVNVLGFIKAVILDTNKRDQLTLANRIMFDLIFYYYCQTASDLADINRAFLNKYLTGCIDRVEIGQFMRTQANLMALLEIYREYDELYIGEETKARENFLQTA